MDWRSWMRGDVVYSRDGLKGIVAGPDPEELVLINQMGQVLSLEAQNHELLTNWKVGIAAQHDFAQERG